jgi:hypothetical protein
MNQSLEFVSLPSGVPIRLANSDKHPEPYLTARIISSEGIKVQSWLVQ